MAVKTVRKYMKYIPHIINIILCGNMYFLVQTCVNPNVKKQTNVNPWKLNTLKVL